MENIGIHSGWKHPFTAFAALPYFSLVDGFLLDGMHWIMNIARRQHGMLLGQGVDEKVRHQAEALKEHGGRVYGWWTRVKNFISPFAIPTEGRDAENPAGGEPRPWLQPNLE